MDSKLKANWHTFPLYTLLQVRHTKPEIWDTGLPEIKEI